MGSFAEDWRRCVRAPGDSSAWENFLGEQRRLLARIVFRVAARFGIAGPDEIDDAVQEICLKMSSQSSFFHLTDEEDSVIETYMKALIANAAHDYFRGQRAKKRDLLAATALDSDFPARTPELKDIETGVLLNQLHGLAGEDSRSQYVFQLYYRFGWTAKEIANISYFGLSAKGVESLVHRLTTELRKKIQSGAAQLPPSRKGSTPETT